MEDVRHVEKGNLSSNVVLDSSRIWQLMIVEIAGKIFSQESHETIEHSVPTCVTSHWPMKQ